MPSLHAGIAFMVAIYGIQKLRTPWRFLLAAYPLPMSFALVYYAEHYVIDVLAGAAASRSWCWRSARSTNAAAAPRSVPARRVSSTRKPFALASRSVG